MFSHIEAFAYRVGKKVYHTIFEPIGLKVPTSVLKLLGVRYGQDGEMAYWNKLWAENEESLPNSHYKRLICGCGNVDSDFFNDKVVLDIGPGPAGSLNMFTSSKARIGVDPLVEKYRAFGVASHNMIYLSSYAEQIPLPSESVDVVVSVNSLDHVRDPKLVVAEAKRLLKTGGYFLVSINLYEDPNPREPFCFTPEIIDSLFSDGYEKEWSKVGPHPIAVVESCRDSANDEIKHGDILYGYKFMFNKAVTDIVSDKTKPHLMWARFRKLPR